MLKGMWPELILAMGSSFWSEIKLQELKGCKSSKEMHGNASKRRGCRRFCNVHVALKVASVDFSNHRQTGSSRVRVALNGASQAEAAPQAIFFTLESFPRP